MVVVFHSRDDLDADQRLGFMIARDEVLVETVTALWNVGGYEKVAEVDSDDLEYALRWTNNVDTSWSMEPDSRVTLKAPLHVIDGQTYGRRSSMVGDVFIVNGVAHVANTGFMPLIFDAELVPELVTALRALLDWGREYTSPTDSNSPHQLLIEAARVIAKAVNHPE